MGKARRSKTPAELVAALRPLDAEGQAHRLAQLTPGQLRGLAVELGLGVSVGGHAHATTTLRGMIYRHLVEQSNAAKPQKGAR